MNIKKNSILVKYFNIPINQFTEPYIKEASITKINHKSGFGHGTCNARISGARLTEKIHMAIKAISDKYNKTGA